ncbi:ribosome maturation factor RimP [Basilea psittacipulmonis]|uniref:Ribosome maturation factor RimP n=1 Tax=Basilea psittacipulmonis DSM 24701 TaxID=1072685 RepID=A0A077DE82_9BURK|nr:ribosome maturation factor RimP [Basilea psittacipulmonis]AIL33150.1 ribosome maturation factor RimP [Basilea psittacipulmonis DSM 24701]
MIDIFQITQDAILGLGENIELIDVERAPAGLLRVTIDTPNGVKIEDCEKVSRQLSRVYEVENVDYNRLEVSSPGLDRPLRHRQDYERFVGERVEIKLHQAINNQKVFKGILQKKEEGKFAIELEAEEKELVFAVEEVAKGKLDPVLDFKGKNR